MTTVKGLTAAGLLVLSTTIAGACPFSKEQTAQTPIPTPVASVESTPQSPIAATRQEAAPVAVQAAPVTSPAVTEVAAVKTEPQKSN